MTIVLNTQRLLGFRISNVAMSAKTGEKRVRTGAKVGGKPEIRIGAKVGLKEL